jgi:hypothetical protein
VGFDGLMEGSAEIAFKWQNKLDDGSVDEEETQWQAVRADLRPGLTQPMELCAVSVAPKLRHQATENFTLSSLQLIYENLAPL